MQADLDAKYLSKLDLGFRIVHSSGAGRSSSRDWAYACYDPDAVTGTRTRRLQRRRSLESPADGA